MILIDRVDEIVHNNDPVGFETLFGVFLENPEGYTSAAMEPELRRANEDVINSLPLYEYPAITAPAGLKQVHLWRFTRKLNGGKNPTVFYQQTGSCVGNGGGQAMIYRSAVDIAVGDPEAWKNPLFYLYPYGRSRAYMGARMRGSGSFGSTMAKALSQDGIFAASEPELPAYENDGGITWGRSTELAWSLIRDGSELQTKYRELAARHKCQTSQPIKDIAQARSVIRDRLGTLTIASTWGGLMQCPLEGPQGYRRRMNRRSGRWPHQMCVIAWEDHPTLGEIYYVFNSWSEKAHGTITVNGELVADDSLAPAGGFWIKADELAWICRNGEVYPFFDYDGYPAEAALLAV